MFHICFKVSYRSVTSYRTKHWRFLDKVKKALVRDSSIVSEFVGTNSAVQKVLWVQNLLIELQYVSAILIILHQVNKSAIQLIAHKGHSGRTKHIALRFNMIRNAVKQNAISTIQYIPTQKIIAIMLKRPQ